jgi:hypothetical protein
MYEELIELIESMKINYDDGMKWCFNVTIDEVIETIKSYKPKVLDVPNGDGWYYFVGEIMGEQTECYIQVQEQYWGTAYMRPSTHSIHCGTIDNIGHVKGKWIKVR